MSGQFRTIADQLKAAGSALLLGAITAAAIALLGFVAALFVGHGIWHRPPEVSLALLHVGLMGLGVWGLCLPLIRRLPYGRAVRVMAGALVGVGVVGYGPTALVRLWERDTLTGDQMVLSPALALWVLATIDWWLWAYRRPEDLAVRRGFEVVTVGRRDDGAEP